MKKCLTMAVALAMAACFALGIAACAPKGSAEGGSGTPSELPGDGGSDTPSGLPGDGGSDTPSGKLPDENFEAAWVAAFDRANFENFKIEGTLYYECTDPTAYEEPGSGTTYAVLGVRADGRERYSESEQNGIPDESSDSYYGGEGEGEFLLEMLEELYYGAKDHAADFTFDDEKGLYVWEQEVSGEEDIVGTVTVCFSFKDGKIAHFVHDRIERFPDNERYHGIVTEYRYDLDYTYGGQTVTPTV